MQKTIRAKLQLQEVTDDANGKSKSLMFRAVYDPSIPEDQRFAKSTPFAELKMTVDEPGAMEHFRQGGYVYLDFTPI